MKSLCNNWEFTPCWSEEFMQGEGSAQTVRLPHTVKEVPLHYAGPEDYELLCGYRRVLNVAEELRGKRLFLQFDGAAHIASVYINGVFAAEHRSGYTAFRVDITELVNYGEDNLISVKLDSSENGEIPPFGFVIDYLTYGGLYREVWLDIREQSYIEDVFVTTPDLKTADVRISLSGELEKVRLSILDGEKVYLGSEGGLVRKLRFEDAQPWDIDSPKLYVLRAELLDAEGKVADTVDTTFGFRTAQFKADGFYLNGKKTFLRGLNRHQCYPYMGYAAPESLQREDARILKNELQCTAVRTSHYPQSQYFIDECDRIGLLVFTEIPGWQHIGDESWQEQAVENTREMVLQYRNHPSIVLWGVRINESQDNDALYERTNALAHELDPSRATSGVRFILKSSLLEDVYGYNDFSHTGNNPGVRKKKNVTPNMEKPLLITEHNGHMFPTKSFDPWWKRQEQALRHAKVQDDAAASGEHTGCFGWCMFDYPTHKDFGSGDRVCYHGVMDAFRNPKLASSLYASQGETKPVLDIGSPMDIGDYAGGQTGDTYIFTNADSVDLYKNGKFVKNFVPEKSGGLKHLPIYMDDTIGALLESEEGFDKAKSEALRRCLLAVGKYGLASVPAKEQMYMLSAMLRYKVSAKQATDLYGKYVGNWGGESTQWHFKAIKDGKVVAENIRCPSKQLHLEATVSSRTLSEKASYDMASVRIRIADEFNNTASYAQLPVCLKISGDAELVGPAVVTAEGGLCGSYVRSTGKAGKAQLTISTAQTEDVVIEFSIEA